MKIIYWLKSELIIQRLLFLCILTSIFRGIFPYSNYLFIPIVLLTFFLYFSFHFNLRSFRYAEFIDKAKYFLIIVLFYIFGLFHTANISTFLLKEIFNVIFFLLVFVMLHDLEGKINAKRAMGNLINYFIYASIAASLIAVFSLFSTSYNYLGNGINEVGFDKNYVSAFLLMGLVGLIYKLNNKSLHQNILLTQIAFLLVFFAILFGGSRRAIFVLSIILVLYLISFLWNKNKFNRKHKLILISIIFSIVLFLSAFLMFLKSNDLPNVSSKLLRNGITNLYVKVCTLSNPDINREYIENYLWDKEKLDIDITQNLIYNGDFKDSLNNWKCQADSTKIEVINNPLNENSVKISRSNGSFAVWPLKYKGRRPVYYEGVTYTFEFMFKVHKGKGTPFNIGWWLMDTDSSFDATLSLKKNILDTTSNWKLCKCEYTFKKSHLNDFNGFFLNSQWPNTTIEIKDVKLYSNDSLKRPLFYDQIPREPIIDSLFVSRTEKWDFAYKLWKEDYNIIQKIFGNGFNYLPKYGVKFHADKERYDYPHNIIISTFLFSGLVGGIIFTIILLIIFYKYIKFRRNLLLFSYFYIIIFIFMMFSANSYFSVPLFIFLSIIPFQINSNQDN